MPRALVFALALALAMLTAAAPAAACGGLIGPNGAVNLLRTTTFVGYHDGIEHYVTAFQFAGGGGKFGSLTPLPGVPSNVEKGGSWTLQRLIRETQPVKALAAAVPAPQRDAAGRVEILLETKIDALDITVLRGGGAAVGEWATAHGFRLPADAPEVLDFYAERSPIFLAAAFDGDAAAARGQQIGDGTPVHITIPTSNPWVPLRILALGKQSTDLVQADVYLLTDRKPAILPLARGANGLTLAYDQTASKPLLDDLRSDTGMGWIPANGWLSQLRIDTNASTLRYDLAVDVQGHSPSRIAAGLEAPGAADPTPIALTMLAAVMAALALVAIREQRRTVLA
ncbi:MAG: DUF2330 domain-containing protein [Chloroflexota bacterium]|nr:DUF2330 domain-containing protein [Chloroflexota bacterium]